MYDPTIIGSHVEENISFHLQNQQEDILNSLLSRQPQYLQRFNENQEKLGLCLTECQGVALFDNPIETTWFDPDQWKSLPPTTTHHRLLYHSFQLVRLGLTFPLQILNKMDTKIKELESLIDEKNQEILETDLEWSGGNIDDMCLNTWKYQASNLRNSYKIIYSTLEKDEIRDGLKWLVNGLCKWITTLQNYGHLPEWVFQTLIYLEQNKTLPLCRLSTRHIPSSSISSASAETSNPSLELQQNYFNFLVYSLDKSRWISPSSSPETPTPPETIYHRLDMAKILMRLYIQDAIEYYPWQNKKLPGLLINLFLDIDQISEYDRMHERYDIRHFLFRLYHGPRREYFQPVVPWTGGEEFDCRIWNDFQQISEIVFQQITQAKEIEEEARALLNSSSSDEDDIDQEMDYERENRILELKDRSTVVNNRLDTYSSILTETLNFALYQLDAKALSLARVPLEKMTVICNYLVYRLTGKKSRECRLTDPSQAPCFRPLDWIAQICQIYTNIHSQLSNLELEPTTDGVQTRERLISAISKDQRSFSVARFEKWHQTLWKHHDRVKMYRWPSYLSWQDFDNSVIFLNTQNIQVGLSSVENLGNILIPEIKLYLSNHIDYDKYDPPTHFCDPLLMTLMKDPVKLPGSDIWMDREVIQKHLGDQPCNPFNREPLTLAEIETENSLPEVQISKNKLLKEIADWKMSLDINSPL